MNAINAAQEDLVVSAKKPTLMDIVARFRQVLFVVDELDGEVTDDLFAALEGVEADFATKVDRCLWISDEAGARAKFIRERARALTEQARVLEGQQERLCNYVKTAMELARIQKLSTQNYVSVAIRKSPASVDIEEFDVFVKMHKDDVDIVTWDPKVNKKGIAERLKAGLEVQGATLITNKTHLQVK